LIRRFSIEIHGDAQRAHVPERAQNVLRNATKKKRVCCARIGLKSPLKEEKKKGKIIRASVLAASYLCGLLERVFLVDGARGSELFRGIKANEEERRGGWTCERRRNWIYSDRSAANQH